MGKLQKITHLRGRRQWVSKTKMMTALAVEKILANDGVEAALEYLQQDKYNNRWDKFDAYCEGMMTNYYGVDNVEGIEHCMDWIRENHDEDYTEEAIMEKMIECHRGVWDFYIKDEKCEVREIPEWVDEETEYLEGISPEDH